MEKEINLLPQKSKGLLQQERTLMAARAIAIGSVCIVVVSFIAVVLLGRNYSVQDAQVQQTSAENRLQLLHGKILRELTLVDRVNRIQTILKTRTLLTPTLILLQKQIPSGVTMETVSITKTSVTLLVSSDSLSALQKCINSFTALIDKKTLFAKLTINNVVVNATSGLYTVSMQGSLL